MVPPLNFTKSNAKATDPFKADAISDYCATITVDQDNVLSKHERKAFSDINKRFDSVFSPTFGAYNDKSGHIRASVNMGPVEPPQIKGKLPLYNSSNMQRLQ